MEHVACDLCGATDTHPYMTTSDRFTGVAFNLVMCNRCQLVYLNPRPNREEIEAQYPDNYEAYRLTEQYDSKIEKWHVQRALEKQLAYVESHRPEQGQLLDVGCATGNFLYVARDHGWQVLGVEIQEKAAKIARQQFNIEVITTDLIGAGLPPASQDVVTLWDVVEHLFSPRSDMLLIHKLLKPGGMVFFSIPNLNSYDRRLFKSNWIGWDAPRHLTFFSELTLNRLLEETGFEIMDRRCILGGRGAFLLSIERIIQQKPYLNWVRRVIPMINIVTWPYRQFAYIQQRGPIIYYAIRKIKV
jgi:2-polyprenyl-3-methyl-5-hydroxy-6-metoxy-1,4-benzoquinol methylase